MDVFQIFIVSLFLAAGLVYAQYYVNKNEIKELNANEAKELAAKNRITQSKNEIERVNKEIHDAVFLGKNFLTTYTDYDNEVEFYFKSKGYQFAYFDKLGEKRITIIKW